MQQQHEHLGQLTRAIGDPTKHLCVGLERTVVATARFAGFPLLLMEKTAAHVLLRTRDGHILFSHTQPKEMRITDSLVLKA